MHLFSEQIKQTIKNALLKLVTNIEAEKNKILKSIEDDYELYGFSSIEGVKKIIK